MDKSVKKLIVPTLIGCLFLTGCNKKFMDFQYNFDYAIIKLPNGEVVEGAIEYWTDYEGEQLQVCIDGKVYLVSSINCVMIADKSANGEE